MTAAGSLGPTVAEGDFLSGRGRGQLSLLRNVPLIALGLGHGAVDLCANALPVFYPMLMAALNLSYASAGALVTVQSASSSLSQPFFGWLSDRFGGRMVAVFAVLLAASACGMVGYAPGYYPLLVVVALLGLGIAAYHPQGAKTATILGGPWRTTSLSIYMVLGSLGYASGPLMAATLLVPSGLKSTPVLLLPAILVALLLFATLGKVDRRPAEKGPAMVGPRGPISWMGVAVLGVVIVARSWVSNGLVAFLPLLYSARGHAPQLAGEMMFLLFALEGGGMALGGWMADRVGRKLTIAISFLLLVPLLHLFLSSEGTPAVALAIPVGILMGASVTVTLAMAQEILPSRMGMASGIAISLSQIMGGIGVALQGILADRYGLEPSMETLVAASLVAAAASLRLTERRGRNEQGQTG